ncbi:MAG: fumarate reductase [Bdellovibrionales bacterium GWA2_49_15]|nr:MAG: fumarate reductase [Bdellovibrionales bacterium GWA2_49_15]HAZ13334.1 succinate dehydrogenase/fumarate reductase iron-sulfur subunit [Bdellovibrionales bacterium]
MRLSLKIWRQANTQSKGQMVDYDLDGVSPEVSFLEMMDQLNEKLIKEGKDPVAFDHDCREGICGMCGVVINGQAHGPEKETTTCQLHMRKFKNGDTIVIEPFRAKTFPVLKDLMINRSAFDEMIKAGGFVTVNTGQAPDAHTILVPKGDAELSMDAAQCIGCAACVASCKNASAMLFVSAKISHFALLPQGQAEAQTRVLSMVEKMDELGFGNCTNEAECEANCPKNISISNIARMNRQYLCAAATHPSK